MSFVTKQAWTLGHDTAAEMAREGYDGVPSPQFFTKSQVALDDDFEGLRVLTKTSLLIIPKNGHLSCYDCIPLVRWKGRMSGCPS